MIDKTISHYKILEKSSEDGLREECLTVDINHQKDIQK